MNKRVLFVSFALALAAASASARPGGGHTYSGSSSSSSRSSGSSSSSSSSSSGSGWSSTGSGSGSSGGGEAAGALIGLLFENPLLGGLLLAGLVGWALISKKQEGSTSGGWEARAPEPVRESVEERAAGQSEQRQHLEAIRKIDPDFSLVLFEDFLYALFSEAHVARGAGKLERLSPWLSQAAREALAAKGAREVRDIVIGAVRYVEVLGHRGDSANVSVTCEIEANYTATEGDRPKRYWVVERWTLARKKDAKSRPPAKAAVFECPSCGAALEAIRGRECSYCKQTVDTGAFDWVVKKWLRTKRKAKAPELGGHEPEQGTDLPTVYDPSAQKRWAALCRQDPDLSWPKLRARLEHVFFELQRGWNERKPLLFRPYVTDGVFQGLCYWLDAYERQGLRNVNDEASVDKSEIVRVVNDAHFSSVTVRVFANGNDYTLDENERVVGGSTTERREYSEYWTLIRSSKRQGAPSTDDKCPNCGAPLEIGMTGSCAHCQAKVTSGEFDWVLSRIEQDDAY